MKHYSSEQIFSILKEQLKYQCNKFNLLNESVEIKFRPLSPLEAIGNTKDQDYPIIKGKEKMIEASFKGAAGQAFTDEYGNYSYTISELLTLPLTTNRNRANFIAALNAVYKYLEICKKTIHCKDNEPEECGKELLAQINENHKILLIGLQPRMLENLSSKQTVRVIDLDPENIGKKKFNILVESGQQTQEAIDWCDSLLVTGTTLINATITQFLNQKKPVLFYGVTISAAAEILNLKTYCLHGH